MRQPKPWFRAAKNAWYVEVNQQKVRLGAHPEGAPPPKKSKAGWNVPNSILEAFYRLMAEDPASQPKPALMQAAALCDQFLDFSQKNHSQRTYQNYRYFLQSFCNVFGAILATSLLPLHITKWLATNPNWKGAKRHAIIAIKSAFSWAKKQGILPSNPLAGIKAGKPNARTRVLSKAEQSEILGAIRDTEFREFVEAMLSTGCRPSELCRLSAAHVNLEKGIWEFEEHKTVDKTRKARTVFLPPAMLALSRKLMAKFPQGPLFRGPRENRPFNRNSIISRFARLRDKLPHLKHFVCYNLRHSYATHALVNGVGVAQVAELLGHTSTEMVSKTYGHLADQLAHMREAAKKAVE